MKNPALSPDAPLSSLQGVGPKIAVSLAEKGLRRLEDVLFLLPLRYEDRTQLTPLSQCHIGRHVLLDGQLLGAQLQYGRRRSLLCRMASGGQIFGLRFYYFSRAQQQQLTAGRNIRVYGLLAKGASGVEIYHPEYQLFEQQAPPLAAHLTPVYPALEGVGQKQWRKLVAQTLQRLDESLAEDLLAGLDGVAALTPLAFKDCLQRLHFPASAQDLRSLELGQHPAQQRLVVEELLAHHLLRRQQLAASATLQAPALPASHLQQRFLEQLSFQRTAAQQRVCREIGADLQKPRPMLRLLQGDVGSGKTLVAVWAALQAVDAGYQVALMAPTETLAQQHYKTLSDWLASLDVEVGCLLGSLKVSQRKKVLAGVASGQTAIVTGTHALFQPEVEYAQLALVIIDEQHRFGVHQRLALRAKAPREDQGVHQLIMTATPIPRSLAMTLYAGLAVSTIDALPQGRQPVDTLLMAEHKREQLFARMAHACATGRQVYWICTLIENSEVLDSQAVEDAVDMLREALPQLRIAELHGRMKPADKQQVMDAFSAGAMDILVATTVVEVGVDVPNASIIVIENPERLGLAQLHQLRGRVGRGRDKSYCILLYGKNLGQQARARLQTIRKHSDGFKIAEEDLKLRGAGDLFGVRQSGEMALRVADMQRDAACLPQVQQLADAIMAQYPERIQRIIQRWIPGGDDYAQV